MAVLVKLWRGKASTYEKSELALVAEFRPDLGCAAQQLLLELSVVKQEPLYVGRFEPTGLTSTLPKTAC